MKRGDVVIVDFSIYDPTDKVRPALIVQNDRDNNRMKRTIVAVITGNIRRSGKDTQYLIDHSHTDFSASGLHGPSCVNCSNVYTIRQADISRTIGNLSDATMNEVDDCLRAALAIP